MTERPASPSEKFVSEAIIPDTTTFDAMAMSTGEPGLLNQLGGQRGRLFVGVGVCRRQGCRQTDCGNKGESQQGS